MSALRWSLTVALLALLGLLVLESQGGGASTARINAALRQGSVGHLSEEERARFVADVTWLSEQAGVHGVSINQPFEAAERDQRPLHVFAADANHFPQTIALTRCGPGNAIFDRDLKAVFVDAALLRRDEFSPIFDASGVGSVASMNDVPFHRLFFHFVYLHELGHFLKHSRSAAFFDLGHVEKAQNVSRQMEDEADAFSLGVLSKAYEDQVGKTTGLAAFGTPSSMDLDGLPGMTPRDQAALEIASAFMMEGFFKVFAAPNYGSYFEDRAHANLFNRSESVFRRLSDRKLGGATNALSTVERLVALKAAPPNTVRIVELVLPWPIGSAVLTAEGARVANRTAATIATVRIEPSEVAASAALDESIKVSDSSGWMQCPKMRMGWANSCIEPRAPIKSSSNDVVPTSDWLLAAKASNAEDRFIKVAEGPISVALIEPPGPSGASSTWKVRASTGDAWAIDGKVLEAAAAKRLGLSIVGLFPRQVSPEAAFFTVLPAKSGPAADVAIVAAFKDGRSPEVSDMRGFADDLLEHAVSLVDGDRVRHFSWRVANTGPEAGRLWEIVELGANGSVTTVSPMLNASLGADRFAEPIEKTFKAKINWLRVMAPNLLLVANDMDGLFVVNLKDRRPALRPVFPFAFDPLKVSTWPDGRILAYLEGGTRAFVLFPKP